MSWKDNGPRWPGRGTEHFKDGALLGVGKVRTKGLLEGQSSGFSSRPLLHSIIVQANTITTFLCILGKSTSPRNLIAETWASI